MFVVPIQKMKAGNIILPTYLTISMWCWNGNNNIIVYIKLPSWVVLCIYVVINISEFKPISHTEHGRSSTRINRTYIIHWHCILCHTHYILYSKSALWLPWVSWILVICITSIDSTDYTFNLRLRFEHEPVKIYFTYKFRYNKRTRRNDSSASINYYHHNMSTHVPDTRTTLMHEFKTWTRRKIR